MRTRTLALVGALIAVALVVAFIFVSLLPALRVLRSARAAAADLDRSLAQSAGAPAELGRAQAAHDALRRMLVTRAARLRPDTAGFVAVVGQLAARARWSARSFQWRAPESAGPFLIRPFELEASTNLAGVVRWLNEFGRREPTGRVTSVTLFPGARGSYRVRVSGQLPLRTGS